MQSMLLIVLLRTIFFLIQSYCYSSFHLHHGMMNNIIRGNSFLIEKQKEFQLTVLQKSTFRLKSTSQSSLTYEELLNKWIDQRNFELFYGHIAAVANQMTRNRKISRKTKERFIELITEANEINQTDYLRASTLKNLAKMRFSRLYWTDVDLLTRIIVKYLAVESHQTASIPIFFVALNHLDYKWNSMNETFREGILRLFQESAFQNLNEKEFTHTISSLQDIGMKWNHTNEAFQKVFIQKFIELQDKFEQFNNGIVLYTLGKLNVNFKEMKIPEFDQAIAFIFQKLVKLIRNNEIKGHNRMMSNAIFGITRAGYIGEDFSLDFVHEFLETTVDSWKYMKLQEKVMCIEGIRKMNISWVDIPLNLHKVLLVDLKERLF